MSLTTKDTLIKKPIFFRHQSYMILKIHNPCTHQALHCYLIFKLKYCKSATSIILLTTCFTELLLERYYFRQKHLTVLLLKYKCLSSFWKKNKKKTKKKKQPKFLCNQGGICAMEFMCWIKQYYIKVHQTQTAGKFNASNQGVLSFIFQYFNSLEIF